MSDPTEFQATIDLLRDRIRRARRGAVIGAALGALAGVAFLASPVASESAGLTTQVLRVIAAGLLGAAVGSVVGGGRLQRIVNSVLGSDIAAERIKNAVRGTELHLPEREHDRARRYALVSTLALPAQVRLYALIAAASVTGDVARLVSNIELRSSEIPVFTAITGLIPAVAFALLAVQLFRALRQATAYVARPPGTPLQTDHA